MIKDEDAARELICYSLGPLARRLGGKHSKTESMTFRKAACICLDLSDIIELKHEKDIKVVMKELIDTQFTRKFVQVTIQVASFTARSDLSKPGVLFSTPIYWYLLLVLAQLSALFDKANDCCQSDALNRESAVLLNGAYILAPIWRKDENIYRKFQSLSGNVPGQHLLVQNIISSACMVFPRANFSGKPHHRLSFLVDSLSVLLRVRFSIVDASTDTPSPETLKINTTGLAVYSKALMCWPDRQCLAEGFDLEQWASRPHHDIVSHFLRSAADSSLENGQNYRSREIAILARFIVVDHGLDMICALAELDYLTPSISYAKKTLPSLVAAVDDDLENEFRVLMASWGLLFLSSKFMRVHHRLAETMLELGFLFLVEAGSRVLTDEGRRHGEFSLFLSSPPSPQD
ncbi:hypothetical protein DL93DRAFT_2234031 [Clavulina sp. PMI_390]|nr:hypothetical protein DL93DRAFT_2234031 [Clavulina sp. PMI_390]